MGLFKKEVLLDILKDSQIGLWRVELEDGKLPRFYADEVMDYLLGVEGDVSPEERYIFHHNHIHPEDLTFFEEYATKLLIERAEVTYRYIHPDLGELFVRCGGKRDKAVKDKMSIIGTHQNISDTVRLEKDKVAETRLAEKKLDLERQLEIIQAFGKAFNSAYYIDLASGQFIELGAQLNGVRDIVGESGDAREKFEAMCKYILLPEHVQEMREFTDLSTLNERMKSKQWISKQFEGNLNGWSEGVFIAASRDEEGNVDHVIWATRSIVDIKKKELAYQEELKEATKKAQIANEAKTRFLFNMSHDIRTPMNAIIGFTELITQNINNPDLCLDYLSKIKNANDFLLALINNVLEMAKIESGKAVLDECPTVCMQFFSSITSLFDSPMEKKNISLTKSVSIKHQYIFVDQIKLREIFLNIISNAYKYTPSGGTVSMELTELESDRPGYGLFRSVIRDTGIGMSKEFIPTIFEEFTRERNLTDSKIEGTGLGMPIVKKLVELMGGTITVESEVAKGTAFTVMLYHKIADSPEECKCDAKVEDIQIFKGKRILLAEDNDLNAEIVEALLGDVGLQVERAEDGIVCVDMLNKAPEDYYDIILMDIQMPNLNGYEATKIIRKLNDRRALIPIVALTANAFEEDRKAAFDAGMNGHLAKPVKVDELLSLMSRFM